VDGGRNGFVLLVARPELELEWIQPAKKYRPQSETIVVRALDGKSTDANRRWKGGER